MTKVVNINTSDYDVYIGRAGKGRDGYFGNNHRIGFCYLCNEEHDRNGAINAFHKEFNLRIGLDPEFKKRVLGLKGKVLGCFCKQKDKEIPCHGDVYVKYLDANNQKTGNLVCPWCGEKDFDKLGLKIHVVNGWCDKFENEN